MQKSMSSPSLLKAVYCVNGSTSSSTSPSLDSMAALAACVNRWVASSGRGAAGAAGTIRRCCSKSPTKDGRKSAGSHRHVRRHVHKPETGNFIVMQSESARTPAAPADAGRATDVATRDRTSARDRQPMTALENIVIYTLLKLPCAGLRPSFPSSFDTM